METASEIEKICIKLKQAKTVEEVKTILQNLSLMHKKKTIKWLRTRHTATPRHRDSSIHFGSKLCELAYDPAARTCRIEMDTLALLVHHRRSPQHAFE